MEADAVPHDTCAALALVFAELTTGLLAWQRGLEGWNMRESRVILGWKREGIAEGSLGTKRANLFEAIEARSQTQIPDVCPIPPCA